MKMQCSRAALAAATSSPTSICLTAVGASQWDARAARGEGETIRPAMGSCAASSPASVLLECCWLAEALGEVVVLGLWKALLEVDGPSLCVPFGLGLAVFSSLNLGREVAAVVEKGVCGSHGHVCSGRPVGSCAGPWRASGPAVVAAHAWRSLLGSPERARRRGASSAAAGGRCPQIRRAPDWIRCPRDRARACAWEGRRPVSGDGGCSCHGDGYGWRAGDGLRRRRSWLSATDSGRSGLWRPREDGAGACCVRVSVEKVMFSTRFQWQRVWCTWQGFPNFVCPAGGDGSRRSFAPLW
jgi:hypothetical protein